MPKIIKERKCGIFIDSSNPLDIKDGILRAYNLRGNLKEIGYSGIELVEEEFTWEKQAKKFYEYLKKVERLKQNF